MGCCNCNRIVDAYLKDVMNIKGVKSRHQTLDTGDLGTITHLKFLISHLRESVSETIFREGWRAFALAIAEGDCRTSSELPGEPHNKKGRLACADGLFCYVALRRQLFELSLQVVWSVDLYGFRTWLSISRFFYRSSGDTSFELGLFF